MLRVSLHEQVYVVVRDLQRQNFVSEVVSSLTKQRWHILLHYIQNRVSILRAPDEVILAGTNRMCMTTVLFHS
ncbi:hypothetical protein SAMN05216226_11814 [Halovenus aranensis]|uniref:Uncharacterized protein n=1 Tax=Halovenus aranensis TaxID=890420 RepID=A0A1G8Z6P7_9EURY|nr:hypothetical protein SAMN05216226_11814 [Halovenus aranensis]